MASTSSRSPRTAPQQSRSERRLAGFLEAAAELFAEVGYAAATMTEIAERSSSSIGALYSYFPDKQSIAFTLSMQYAEQLEQRWKPLTEQAATLSHAEFADLFIERITEFVRERPAYLSLLTAPIRFRRDPATRKATRVPIANAFQASNPSLSSQDAFLIANVTLQIVSGMMTLYAETEAKSKEAVVFEFKRILTLYLDSALSVGAVRSKQWRS